MIAISILLCIAGTAHNCLHVTQPTASAVTITKIIKKQEKDIEKSAPETEKNHVSNLLRPSKQC